jgi:K+-transporting ATPase KdpF subunit
MPSGRRLDTGKRTLIQVNGVFRALPAPRFPRPGPIGRSQTENRLTRALPATFLEGDPVTPMQILAAALAVGLLAYLVFALLKPEKFQ